MNVSPFPFTAVFQLTKVYPVLVGAVGRVPTFPLYVAVFVNGLASAEPASVVFLSKLTV